MVDIRKEDGWHQDEVIHCRDPKCKGMLLSHPMYRPMKCSDCDRMWEMDISWREVHPRGKYG